MISVVIATYGDQSWADLAHERALSSVVAQHDGEVIVHCAVGQRGHTATQILRAAGKNVRNLSGGYTTWRAGKDALARRA